MNKHEKIKQQNLKKQVEELYTLIYYKMDKDDERDIRFVYHQIQCNCATEEDLNLIIKLQFKYVI